MTALTDAQDAANSQLITATVLAGTPDAAAAALVTALLPSLWTGLSGVVDPTLRRLTAQRQVLDMLIGFYQDQVDASTGLSSEKSHQRVQTLQMLRTNTQADLTLAQSQATGSSGQSAAWGTLAASSASSVNPNSPGGPVSTDPRYRGSPYYPLRRPWGL